MRKTLASAGALLSVGALALTGCTPNTQASSSSSASGSAASDGVITVTASDTACKLSVTTAKAGKVTFKVKNEGTKVNEFYVLGSDGLRIISEVENIGPNLSRDLTVELPEGSYKTACKPGMVGDGIRGDYTGDFTVTKNENAATISADEQALRDTAVTQYTAYVKDQVEALKTKTEQFAELYTAGKVEEAKALYSSARLHYERIEPVAESFGDLDPALDAREADVEEGKEWTGWHKIEKDLWQPTAEKNGGKEYTPLTAQERAELAKKLVADTQKLYDEVHSSEFKLEAFQISNGAKELLDEVVNTKISGEEEMWSHTDLSDFQGNIDGARVAYEDVLPILKQKDPKLAEDIAKKFDAVQKLLNQHKKGDGFASYDELTKEQVRELSDAVEALSEPVSKMTEVVTGAGTK